MDRATCAWRQRVGRPSGPPLLRFSFVRYVDTYIDLQPEFDSNQAGIVLFHNSPPIPRSITATGSVVVYLLRELLPRWRPRRTFCDFAQHRYHTKSTRTTFYRCLLALGWVESLLGSATNPDAAHLFRGETDPAKISYAARQIVKCLIVLQTPIHRAQRRCLLCTSLPVNARGADENAAHLLEVRSNYSAVGNTNCGFTAIQTISVLPPVRECDPPMLCEFHLYEFQFYMYRVINPTWPEPHLAQDTKKFGAIRIIRWSSTANAFEYEDSINQ